HELAQLGGRHFAKMGCINLSFDAADDSVHLLRGDGALVAGLLESAAELGQVKRLARAILFDHLERYVLQHLYRTDAAIAMIAHATATHREAIWMTPRILHMKRARATIRTFHKKESSRRR